MEKEKKTKKRKGYFYEREEQAVVDYITSTDINERNKIYTEILHPAFTTMIESLIRRYNRYIPDEDFEETFNDTLEYLICNISKFKPEKGAKAYSYCGTICNNYLKHKKDKYIKGSSVVVRCEPEFLENISPDSDFVTQNNDHDEFYDLAEKLVVEIKDCIRGMLEDREKWELTDSEYIVGKSIVELLTNWEEIFPFDDDKAGYSSKSPKYSSNKLQKSKVLYFLREEAMMSTKEIRDNMKKFKNAYFELKKKHLCE